MSRPDFFNVQSQAPRFLPSMAAPGTQASGPLTPGLAPSVEPPGLRARALPWKFPGDAAKYVLGLLLLLAPVALQARPSYAALTRLLPELWKARYPIAAEKFIPNPEKRGVLAATYRGQRVYYYHYHAILPRPRRVAGKEEVEVIGRRKIEVWVRYRPGRKDPYDISFARRDRLPGGGRRWIK